MPNLIRTDDHIYQAVKDWINNRDEAEYIYGHISDWDTSAVTNMQSLFRELGDFNDDISNWNVSNVTDMSKMFLHARSFNQPIGGWDTRNVTNMNNMFFYAISFNQPIGRWNTHKVTMMFGVFWGASSFNQPIGGWDTQNVINMGRMFEGASSFNQDLTNWNNFDSEPPGSNAKMRNFMFENSGMQLINYPYYGVRERLRIGNENRANFDYLSTLASVEAIRNPDSVQNENRAQALRTMRARFQAAEARDPYALYKFGGKKKRKSLKKKRKSKRRKLLKKKQRKTKRKGRK
jgi:surface protein